MSVSTQSADETAVRGLIASWSRAVREEDLDGIRAAHDPEILMFDVPPPFLSRGIETYMATWQTFFERAVRPVKFDLTDVQVTAGADVAFVTGIGHCRDTVDGQLEFRLTVGLCKRDGYWIVVHEHHSLPATS